MTCKARIKITKSDDLPGEWRYLVADSDGRPIAGGWVRGSKREARAAAEEHARQKGLTING